MAAVAIAALRLPFLSFLNSPRRFPSSFSLSPLSSSLFFPSPRCTSSFSFSSLTQLHHDPENSEEDVEEGEDESDGAAAVVLPKMPPPPKLSIKEKKELASYAQSLGKKLKSQQVGKSGVTPSVAASFVENLESNELLKLKIHGNCPGELPDVIAQLEESTGSVAVFQIGRTVILYRPSQSKMQKEEVQSTRQRWNKKPTEPPATFKLRKKRPIAKAASHGRK